MANVGLKHVTKVFDKNVVAVNDATISFEDREFVILVGPSGCGKSTVLRMIAGLESVTDGQIYIDDRLVNDVPSKDRDIAMVFQNYALYPHMTVFENMAFGLKLRKVSKRQIEGRVHEAADILGIRDLLERKPKALSGGQRQRVAVGRAIVRKPKVFLFDEPLSNLDAKLRVQMRMEISRLHKRLKTTMIYVTHDQVEAMTMGDRIVVLKDGVVQQVDSPVQLYNSPTNRFVAGFIGSPPMNFIEGRLIRKDGLKFIAEGIELSIPEFIAKFFDDFIDKDIVFGLRPECIFSTESSKDESEFSRVRAVVDVVEPMGNEAFLHATVNSHELVARLDADFKGEMGQKITLVFDMTKGHFFDRQTDMSIALK